ncbi:MAG: SRPBCC family protein [Proteobacteria bacterium]|nr:MAG: SRPBCC family protein [Pseudomonadota bacterium]
MVLPSKHISISIKASPTLTYGYTANPENLPHWAAGLSSGIRREGESWVTDSPMGKVRVNFSEKNDFGILDHTVTMPTGEKVLNPMRVLPNDDGSEVVFTLFQRKGISAQEFEADEILIEDDLKRLKKNLEKIH